MSQTNYIYSFMMKYMMIITRSTWRIIKYNLQSLIQKLVKNTQINPTVQDVKLVSLLSVIDVYLNQTSVAMVRMYCISQLTSDCALCLLYRCKYQNRTNLLRLLLWLFTTKHVAFSRIITLGVSVITFISKCAFQFQVKLLKNFMLQVKQK